MYKEYYQLNTLPFNMSPDPRFFFSSKGHKRALSYMQYGLTQGEGFIVITGDIGTGKTTIVRKLLKNLDPGTFIARQLVTTNLEENDLIEMLCSSFDLPSAGLTKANLLNQLKNYFIQSYRQNKRVVLIVDEVQNLPAKTVEELRMLSNFQLDNKSLIQSFLVGQKEFIATLQGKNMEQLRQRVIASTHLGPLKQEETKHYINYRLEQAGWPGADLFNDNAYRLVHELTEGVPRRINVFCDRILLFGYLEEVHFFTEEHIKLVADELSAEITSPVKRTQYMEESIAHETKSKPRPKTKLKATPKLKPKPAAGIRLKRAPEIRKKNTTKKQTENPVSPAVEQVKQTINKKESSGREETINQTSNRKRIKNDLSKVENDPVFDESFKAAMAELDEFSNEMEKKLDSIINDFNLD